MIEGSTQTYAEALGKAADHAENMAKDFREKSAAQTAKDQAASQMSWDSLGTEAKLERLRIVVNGLSRTNGEVREELNEVDKIVRSHKHDQANGMVMTPVRQNYSNQGCCGSDRKRRDDLSGAWI